MEKFSAKNHHAQADYPALTEETRCFYCGEPVFVERDITAQCCCGCVSHVTEAHLCHFDVDTLQVRKFSDDGYDGPVRCPLPGCTEPLVVTVPYAGDCCHCKFDNSFPHPHKHTAAASK